MPMLLRFIDAIARQKQRDVVFLSFPPAEQFENPVPYENIRARRTIIEWLDANKIGWQMCGEFANENVMRSYAGQLYIDVPFDEADPVYEKVQKFLEHEDGSMRFSEAVFWAVPLERAMQNAHHDAPGFWEKWAGEF
jgi:hypothetical protein